MLIYPGTKVKTKQYITGKQFLNGLFMGAKSGIVMSQLTEITGLKAPTVQNWVMRGFIPHPINKKYSKDATARIFVINALRATMSLDDIKRLLIYVNGNPDDRSDDIIPESELYGYFCEVISNERFSFKCLSELIDQVVTNYEEKLRDAKIRLKTALEVICVNYLASSLLDRSAQIMALVDEKNIFGKQF